MSAALVKLGLLTECDNCLTLVPDRDTEVHGCEYDDCVVCRDPVACDERYQMMRLAGVAS